MPSNCRGNNGVRRVWYGADGERSVKTESSSSRITQFDLGGRVRVTENATAEARLTRGNSTLSRRVTLDSHFRRRCYCSRVDDRRRHRHWPPVRSRTPSTSPHPLREQLVASKRKSCRGVDRVEQPTVFVKKPFELRVFVETARKLATQASQRNRGLVHRGLAKRVRVGAAVPRVAICREGVVWPK